MFPIDVCGTITRPLHGRVRKQTSSNLCEIPALLNGTALEPSETRGVTGADKIRFLRAAAYFRTDTVRVSLKVL
jgi:hypothetical protein